MKLTVVRTQGKPPSAEDPGETIWDGGYQGEGADELPASALLNADSSLEIGTWYSINKFAQELSSGRREASPWTSVTVHMRTPQGSLEESIAVIQAHAGSVIFHSVLALIRRLYKKNLNDIWIYVE